GEDQKKRRERTNDVCCTNLRNLPEHRLPEEVEEEEGVCGSRRVSETRNKRKWIMNPTSSRLISTGSFAETFPPPIGSICLAAGFPDFIDYSLSQ
ncbi:hypothetical protein DBV15_08828, partial [Temnothorax longispinosus]